MLSTFLFNALRFLVLILVLNGLSATSAISQGLTSPTSLSEAEVSRMLLLNARLAAASLGFF
jgi:hypothetical protein